MTVPRIHRLDGYSIPELLRLLLRERGERIRFDTREEPSLTIKGQEYEIEGLAIDENTVEEMLRPVASNRQMRAFRRFRTVDFVYRFEGARFLIRVVRAYGIFNLE